MTASPVERRHVAAAQIALVRCVILHQLQQLLTNLRIAVDDEHLHQGVEVEGDGNKVSSLVGSARWACNLSL